MPAGPAGYANLLQPAGAYTIGAFFIFLHLLECEVSASPSFSWLLLSIIRRMRTRLPTCLSVELGDFFTAGTAG